MEKIKINNNEDILSYPVQSKSVANIENTLDEWIRFLSYIKPEEKKFLDELNNKSLNQLETTELEKYLKIKNQLEMSKLFIKYKNRDCSKEEHDSVFNFMENSLISLMKDRLTEKELNSSYKILSEFYLMSETELGKYIDDQMNNYENLTIFEAYILFMVKEIKYTKITNKTNKKIKDEQIDREYRLRKSLIRDYGLM